MIEFLRQPANGQLGTILRKKLCDGIYNQFTIVSAFAKNSGVLRLKEELLQFRAYGGKVYAFIGIDAHGTSYEAVCNLFSLVDELYIIHDRKTSVTFHAKAYYLGGSNGINWLAVGSNNLTGGGLWTNTEWATIIEGDNNPDTNKYFGEFYKQIIDFKSDKRNISLRINDLGVLDRLLASDLLRREIQIQLDNSKVNNSISRKAGLSNPFGTYGNVHIPKLSNKNQNEKILVRTNNEDIVSTVSILPTDTENPEKMWFETREMTGGSRNILDLSMLGSLVRGSSKGTRYETDKNSIVLGSVAFFDINPTNTAEEKNITINYNAKDYRGCTIKMHQTGANPNGSWRIQLKGETLSGEKLTTAGGGDWLVHKVLIMEKIKTDYYVMSVLPEEEIYTLKSRSLFVARNGRSIKSKQYGLLDF